MNRISARLALLVFFLILLPPATLAETKAGNEFLILYSNNVNGEIEPCG